MSNKEFYKDFCHTTDIMIEQSSIIICLRQIMTPPVTSLTNLRFVSLTKTMFLSGQWC